MKKQLLASIGVILFSATIAFGQNCTNDVTAPTPGDASGNAASVQTTYTSQNPLQIHLGSAGTAGFGVGQGQYDAANETGAQLFLPAANTSSGNKLIFTTATDDCSTSNFPSISASKSSFDCSDIGSAFQIIIYYADASSNIVQASMFVEVTETVDPVLTVSDVTLSLDANGAATLSNHGSATDNCDTDVDITYSLSAFDCSHLGQNSVVVTAEDDAGNQSQETITVTIEDVTAPTISAPSSATLVLDNNGSATLDVTTITATDNCETSPTITYSRSTTYACSDVGTSQITVTATDGQNPANTSTHVIDVTVEDNTDPTLTAPADVTVNVDAGACSAAAANVTLGNPTAADNCSVTTSNDAPSSYPVGTTTVTWTAVDPSGNDVTATQTVTVVDNIDPVLTVADVSISLDANGNVTLANHGSATDNCTANPTISYDVSSFTCAELGANTVVVTAADANGNSVDQSITVTVVDDIDPVLTVSNITLVLDANGDATLANHGSATDNCTTANITYSETSFDCNDLGANAVDVTATDGSGNAVTQQITVTIEDNTDPTVAGATVNLFLDANGSGTISDVTTLFATATDNTTCTLDYQSSRLTFDCDDLDFDQTISNPSQADANNTANWGTTAVTITLTDAAGNSSTATAQVRVIDNEKPNITAPSLDLDLNAQGFVSIANTMAQTLATVTADNCSLDASRGNINQSYFDCDDLGSNTVTAFVFDSYGNTRVTAMTVQVNDVTAPAITAVAGTVTLSLDANGSRTVVLSDVFDSAADNCTDGASLTNALSGTVTFDCSHAGTTQTITMTSEDASGNVSTATKDVEIVDNTNPTITLLNSFANINVGVSGSVTIQPSHVVDATADNCSVSSVTISPNSFTCSDAGTTPTVTVTATDASGNVTTETATVNVVDATAPTIVAVSNIAPVDLDASGNASISLSDVMASVSDICDSNPNASISPSTFDCTNTGNNTVTITATDASNNTSTQTVTVVVQDVTDPTLTAPANVTVNVDAGACSADAANVTLGNPTAADNCSVTTSNDAPNSYPVGTTTVTWTAVDPSGNDVTSTQTVTVVDNIDPTLTVPANVTVNVDAGACSADAANVTLGNPTAADNCSVTTSNDAPSSFPVGTTTVTWTAVDPSGNDVTATQTVTVVDNIDPTITAPADVTVNVDAGQCSAAAANVTLGTPVTADNCAVSSTTNDAPNSFPVGTTTVTWTVTDASGRTATASQDVTVVDNIDPTLSVPAANISANTSDDGTGDCTVDIAVGDATFADNCSADLSWVLTGATTGTGNGQVGTQTFEIGTTTITYTAEDPSGNGVTAVVTVVVADDEDPTVAAAANVTANTGDNDPGDCDAEIAITDATFSDNCTGAALTWAMTGATAATGSGQVGTYVFPIGTTTITYTVTDGSNNDATSQMTVTVTDDEDPTVSAAANIAANTSDDGAGNCDVDVAVPDATFADNCSGVSLAWVMTGAVTDNANGQVGTYTFPIGTTTITYTATDASNRTATSSLTVTVTDDEDPTVAASGNVTANTSDDGTGDCTVDIAITDATFADNCTGSSIAYAMTGATTLASTNGQVGTATFEIGTTTITYTVTDGANRTATSTMTVVVTDDEDPTLSVANNVTANTSDDGTGDCTVDIAITDATFADNCSGSALTYVMTGATTGSGNGQVGTTSFTKGTTTISYTVTDGSNRTVTESMTVTVTDDEDPSITTVAGTVTLDLDANGSVTAVLSDVFDSAADNCTASGDIVTALDQTYTFDCDDVGVTQTISMTSEDEGNTTTVTKDVEIADNIAPTASVVATYDVYLDASGAASVAFTDLDNGSSDNCSFTSTIQDNNFDCDDAGQTIEVTGTLEDPSGNSTNYSSDVTVHDTIAPVFATVQTAAVTLNSVNYDCFALAAWDAPTYNANDQNCSGTITTSYELVDASGSVSTVSLGNPVAVGTYTVRTVATDANGNVRKQGFTLNVVDNTDPTITFVANPSVDLDASGSATLTSSMLISSSYDNCGIDNITFSPSTVDCDDVASGATVAVTATDFNGNTATYNVTVAVNDVTAPSLSVIGSSYSVVLDASGAGSVSASDLASATDNCSATPSLSVSPSSFTCSDAGSVTVTITATDDAGNTSTATKTISVVDNAAPVITVSNTTLALDGNGVVTLPSATATAADNCTSTPNVTYSKTTFTCSDLGANTVTVTAADANGNVATQTFTVTVEDNIAPTVTMLSTFADVALDASGAASISINNLASNVSDNCGTPTLTITPSTFSCTDLGSSTVTVVATDASGNATSHQATITVVDNTAPSITAVSGAVTVVLDASGAATITTTDVVSSTSDNCTATPTVTITPSAFGCADLGSNTVTITATDASGNANTATKAITVVDNAAPTIVASNTTISLDANGVAVLPNATASATDNCSAAPSIAYSQTTFTCADLGANTVTITATDASGNTATSTITVTVDDNIAPSITTLSAIADVALNVNGAAAIGMNDVVSSVTDNCGAPTVTITPSTFGCGDLGTNTVTITATDASGNTTTSQVTLTVVDNTAPSITAVSGAVTVVLDASGAATIATSDVVSSTSDNCTSAPTVSITPSAFGCADLGSNTVTITATDASGNVSTATKAVTVVDNAAPTIVASNTTITLDANGVAVLPNATATATDNCSATPSIGYSQTTFTCADLGANTVTITATDASGNAATSTITVTVDDNIAPSITTLSAIADVALNVNGAAVIGMNDVVSSVTDNCGAPTVTITPSNFSCGDLGTNTVTITATDASGNATTSQVTLTVVDNSAPTIATVSGVVTVTLDANGAGAISQSDVVASVTDNCTATPTVTLSATSFDCSDLGSNTITITATDASGNVKTATKTVTVVDNTAPTITAPASITLTLGSSGAVSLPLSTASAADNCSGAPSLTYSATNFSCADAGSNTITITSVDASGNSSTTTMTVVVQDNTAPSLALTTAPVTLVLDASGSASLSTAQLVSSATDNCSSVTLSVSPSSFGCSDLGSNTVTVTATDASGNTTTATASVTVADQTAPTIATVGSAVTVYLDANGSGTISTSDVVSSTTDNCTTAPTVSLSTTSFGCADLGSNTVTITATDGSGNASTATKSVTVVDTISPTITAPASLTLTLGSGGTVNLPATTASATDNCSGSVTLSYSVTSFSCSDVGSNTVTVTATDANGNATTSTMTVTVQDNTAPTLALNTTTTTLALDASGSASLAAAQLVSSVSDNCSGVTISVSPSSFGCSDLGANTVTVTATDANGNSTTATTSVTVVDNIDPVVTTVAAPADVVLGANGTATITQAMVIASATDNCTTSPTITITPSAVDCSDLGSTTITILATDASGNVGLATVNVTVVDQDAPVIVSAPSDTTLAACNAQLVYNYNVTDNCGYTANMVTGLASGSTFPLGTTTVTYEFSDASGNTATHSFDVTVDTLGTYNLPANTEFCADNGPVDLSLGQTGLTFAGDGIAADGQTFQPAVAGVGLHTLSFTYTDANGCIQVGSITVRVYPVPAQPLVLQVLPTVLESSVTGARYQWFKGGVWIQGETSKQLNITTGGNYQVKVFNAYDCDRMSTGLVISSTGLSIDEVFNTLNIFPNPTQSLVVLEFGVSLESDMSIQVIDIAGRTVHLQTITSGTQSYRMDLSPFKAGAYQIVLRDSKTGAVSVEQIIKVD